MLYRTEYAENPQKSRQKKSNHMKKSILFLVFACSIYSYGATAAKTQQVKRYAISETAILNRFLDYVAIESA